MAKMGTSKAEKTVNETKKNDFMSGYLKNFSSF